MFTKVFSTISILVALSVHVNGHTLMTPALGVQGAGARSDVQVGLLDGGGCGSMDVASNIDSSTPVAAAPDGTFTVTATNFNRLRDGSREVTAKMDSTGTGKNFNTAVTVTQNGDPRPKSLGSDQIVAKLPAGTTCTGGASGNLCLVSFENGAIQKFGNCVVVSQAAASSGTAAGAATGTAATGASDTSAVGASTGSTANEAGAGTGASTGTTANTGVDSGVNGAVSGAGVATGSTATGAVTGASGTSAVGASTGSTANEAGAGTGVSTGTTADTSVAAGVNGAASGVSDTSSGVSDTSAIGASTGSAATEGVVSAGTTGVGAGVNDAASGAGVATSGSTTATTRRGLSQAGTRAARALLDEIESLGDDLLAEDPLDLVRRGIVDWIWA